MFDHTLVALAHHGVEFKDVYRKLQQRRRLSRGVAQSP
ncbi:MAG TPA: hypothetical protein V6D11_13595 [Waterburya sp.]